MTILLSDFAREHPNYRITHVNGQGLCIESDYEYDVYYIKVTTEKHRDVDWTKHDYVSLTTLDDAVVVASFLSAECDLFG